MLQMWNTSWPDAAKEALIHYVDRIVSTTNPAVLPDGSNLDDAPSHDPHICNLPYAEVEDFNQDLADLVATCQRHTCCSAAYCLRTCNGQLSQSTASLNSSIKKLAS